MTAQIEINDTLPRTQIIATSGQLEFDTDWTANVASDIDVYLTPDGVDPDDATQLVNPNLYNVTFIGGQQTVRVTFISGVTLDDIITIVRNTPASRTNLYTNTNFTTSMLNQDFGILTLVDQQAQLYDEVITPHYNLSATIEDKDLILPVLGSMQAWRMNEANTAIELVTIPDGGFAPEVGSFVTVTDERTDLPNSFPLADLGNASTSGMGIPAGTTAQRVTPTAPNIGLRFNTDLAVIEAYIGGAWVEIPSSAAGLFLPLAGGTMSGPIDMGAELINNVLDPVSDQDAATKIYVDTVVGGSVGGAPGNIQWNDAGAFGGDPNFNTDGAGNVTIDGSLEVDNLSFNGNRISPTTGLVELEDAQLFNDLDADNNKIINLDLPTAGGDAANKEYVDSVAAGFFFLEPVRVASTANFTSTYNNGASGVGATLTATVNGAASLDGVSLALNDRVLFKNQTSTLENGIYYVSQVGSGGTPAIYTRALDYDEPSDIDPGDMATVLQGTSNASTFWVETAVVTTIGTDPITFTQFGVAAGNIVTITGSQTVTGQKTFVAPILGAASATSLSFTSTSGIIGTTTNNNAAAGSVGEVISSIVPVGSAFSISTSTYTDITSISLTAGDWDLYGNILYIIGGGGSISTRWSAINNVSVNLPSDIGFAGLEQDTTSGSSSLMAPYTRYSLAATTTIYLVGYVTIVSGTVTVCGNIFARRAR
jgi:hypothetical protein